MPQGWAKFYRARLMPQGWAKFYRARLMPQGWAKFYRAISLENDQPATCRRCGGNQRIINKSIFYERKSQLTALETKPQLIS